MFLLIIIVLLFFFARLYLSAVVVGLFLCIPDLRNIISHD